MIALYFSTPDPVAKNIIAQLPGDGHEAIRCDIKNSDEVNQLIHQIYSERGAIDVCVHAAVDPIIRKGLPDFTDAEFQNQLGAAVFGGFHFLTAVGKKMKMATRGAIIGILSKYVDSETSAPHSKIPGYVMAKYALRGILKELSLELAPYGITVNAIMPDFLETKLNADLPKEVRTFIKDKMSVGSIRTLEAAAEAVAFLASERGASITGQIYSPNAAEIRKL